MFEKEIFIYYSQKLRMSSGVIFEDLGVQNDIQMPCWLRQCH